MFETANIHELRALFAHESYFLTPFFGTYALFNNK